MLETRVEEDFIGKVQVPADAYYGIFAVRASRNFKLSTSKPSRFFLKMLSLCKKSAAEANKQNGELDTKLADAICQAAQEVAEGKFDDQFILDSYTAGAGTPFNMNMNEVLANRANELLGSKKGSYSPIHPNNHVNMSQSSNDVIPAAIRLTLLFHSQAVLSEADKLAAAIEAKSSQFSSIVKAGRTHLMDAVPLTVGDELSAFSAAIRMDIKRITSSSETLCEFNLGATALGSGINTHPDYQRIVAEKVSANTGIKVKTSPNLFRITSQSSDFLQYSSALRLLAVSLHKLSNDLKLLSSGPNTAIGEYLLPEVEPGSSIMPGKVNPSVPECLEMIANKVIGNDASVLLAAAGGQLQLNVQTPLILQCLEESSTLIANGMKMMRADCIEGLRINEKKIAQNLDATLIALTALAPYFGYAKMSELVKTAQKEGIGVKETVLREKLLSEEDYDKLMSPKRLTRPAKKEKIGKK
jgi:aspartate ammonia-lyase